MIQRSFLSNLILILACALALHSQMISAFNGDFPELRYEKNLSFELTDFSDTTATVRFLNNNTDLHQEIRSNSDFMQWFAVPPKSQMRYEMKEATWSVFWANGEVEGPFGLLESSSVGPMPQNMNHGSEGTRDNFRSVGLSPLNLRYSASTSRRDPEYEQGTIIINSAVLEITVSGGMLNEEAPDVDLSKRDPYLLSVAKDLFVNPEQVQAFSREMDGLSNINEIEKWNSTLEASASEAPTLLARVAKPGIYRLTPLDLQRLNVDPSRFVGNKLQILVGGKRVPVLRHNGSDGPFINQSHLTFFVPPNEIERSPYIPVWITQLPDGAEETKLIQDFPYQHNLDTSDSDVQLYSTAEIFKPTEFNQVSYPFTQKTGNWLSAKISPDRSMDFDFLARGVDASTTSSIELTFGGLSNSLESAHETYINGQLVGSNSMYGQGPFPERLEISPGILTEMNNTLSIRYPTSQITRTQPILLFASAEVRYAVDSKNIPFNQIIQANGSIGSTYQFTAIHTDNSKLPVPISFDITDPLNPISLESSRRTSSNSLDQTITGKMKSEEMQFYYSDDDSLMMFGNMQEMKYEELLSPKEGADIIIIADPRFRYALDRYIQDRRNQKLESKLVLTDSIYASFGMGRKGYEPIHDFLKHALANWPGKRPQMVLFVGEASEYWWEYELPTVDISENMVPIYGFANPTEKIRGDAAYAWLSGDGQLADIETGRYSVSTVKELENILTRTIEYEQSPVQSPWLTRHLFFTDDEPEFARVANSIIQTELQSNTEPVSVFLQDFPYENYFRIFNRKRSVEMTRQIGEEMSRGALTATYLGHGGPNLWSGERIFHYRDLPTIQNGQRRPIMTAASCDTAWVDFPVDPVRRSIGELFISNDAGGGIALYAPVGGTNSYEHDYLLRPFFNAIVSGQADRLGRATMYSRLQYMLYRNQSYVPKQYILLGDPALKIPKVSERIQLQLSPATATSKGQTTFNLNGSVPSLKWGVVDAWISDITGNHTVPLKRSHVRGNKFELDLKMPTYVSPGSYRLVVHAYNESEGIHESIVHEFEVEEADIQLTWVSDPSGEKTYPAGTPTRLKLTVSNNGANPVDGLKLSIFDASMGQTLTETTISLNPQTSRDFEFPIPLPPGVSIIAAKASQVADDGLEITVNEQRIRLIGSSPDLPYFFVPPKLVEVSRTAGPDSTVFFVPVHNLTNQNIKITSATFTLLDSETGSPVGKPHSLSDLEPYTNTVFNFRAPILFPSGNMLFKISLAGSFIETNEEITQELSVPVVIEADTDIEIVKGSVETERRDYQSGETVYVRATVQNNGIEEVDDLQMTLYRGFPWDPGSIAESITGAHQLKLDRPLGPGQSREVRLRWDPPAGAGLNARLFVVANSSRTIQESNFSNNVGDVAVNMRRLPNLRLISDKTLAEPSFCKEGDIVTVTVGYENNSLYDFAHPFVIEIRAESERSDPALIYRTTIDGLEAGASGVLQATWRADGLRDRIYIGLNEEKEFGEDSATDNNAVIPLSYIITESEIVNSDGSWSFEEFFEFGSVRNVFLSPDGSIKLTGKPSKGSLIPFRNEDQFGAAIPENRIDSDTDNKMLLQEGALSWTALESPEPVEFTLPLPEDDGTTLYDIYLNQYGVSHVNNRPANRYRYRVADNDWIDNADFRNPRVSIGRIETKTDRLNLSFAPTKIRSENYLGGIYAVPIKGSYVSTYFNIAGLPSGSFMINADANDQSRIELQYRVGSGKHVAPEFNDWQDVTVGQQIPGNPESTIIQIRADLYGGLTSVPSLYGVSFIPNHKHQIAGNQ